MPTTWIVRNSDSAWMVKGFGDPSLINSQPANYTAVEIPADDCPNPRTERYDAGSATKRRAATSAEIKAYDDVMVRDKVLGEKPIKALATLAQKRIKRLEDAVIALGGTLPAGSGLPAGAITTATAKTLLDAEYDAL